MIEFGFVAYYSQFNTLQYSDAESVAKIDSELKQAQSELDQLVKEKHESQEQLDKQNSKSILTIILIQTDLLRTTTQRPKWCSTFGR